MGMMERNVCSLPLLCLIVLFFFISPALAQNCSAYSNATCEALHRSPCDDANTNFLCGACLTNFTGPATGNTSCLAECNLAPNCTELHRGPCRNTSSFPHTCSGCFPTWVGANFSNERCNASCANAPNCTTLFRHPCNETLEFPNQCGDCIFDYFDPNKTGPSNTTCWANCSLAFTNCTDDYNRHPCTPSLGVPHTCGACLTDYITQFAAEGEISSRPGNSTCVDTNPCKFLKTGQEGFFRNQVVRIGQRLTIPTCVSINSRNKTAFYTRVDEYSLLHLQQSGNQTYWNATARNINSTTVQLQIGNAISPVLEWTWETQTAQLRLPFATAIVEVNNGLIERIKWDTGCYTCDRLSCYKGQCGIDQAECFANGQDCDLKIYLAWVGVDVNGKFLFSSGKTISRFSRYSVASAWRNAAATAGETYPSVFGENDGIPNETPP